MPEERQTKDQRREAAREVARIEREKMKKREARNRIFLRGGVTLGILAVLGVVALVIVIAVQPPGPGPRNMLSDGILLTSEDGTVIAADQTDAIPSEGEPVPTDPSTLDTELNIVVYVDYLCPFCKLFEDTNAATIDALLRDGVASLEVHPISILDRASLGSRYSSRAANAMACVADLHPNQFYDASAALFTAQPAENTEGLSNESIIGVIGGAGVLTEELSACINDERFKSWVTAASQRATDGPLPNADIENVEGTPTVLVNGVRYTGPLDDPQAFIDFLDAQAPTL